VADWPTLLGEIEAGKVQGAYVTGNYPDSWIDDAEAERLARLKDPAFDPHKVVYVETADAVPSAAALGVSSHVPRLAN